MYTGELKLYAIDCVLISILSDVLARTLVVHESCLYAIMMMTALYKT